MRRLALLSAVLFAGCGGLPAAPPRAFTPARVEAPPELEICWLETAGTTSSAGFASAGWSRGSEWDATASAVLVRHPKGSVLIDSGSSPTLMEDSKELGAFDRFVIRNAAGRMEMRGRLPELLRQVGAEPSQLKAVILSHAHPDHAGGVPLLPGVPVWVAAPERALVQSSVEGRSGAVMPAQARAMVDRLVVMPFAAQGYENFDQSYDVFGDGSVVVVPTFGHTPGSVATFVNLSPSRRFVHVGDLISVRESIDRNVGKSRLMASLTDEDGAATKEQVAKLVQLHALDPALRFLPAHDRPAWEELFGAMPKAGSAPRCVRAGAP